MTDPVYERLTDALNARGGATRGIKCKEFFALIEELFNPEEAELATHMPLGPVTAEALAAEVGKSAQEVGEMLEGMANKGVVFSRDRDGQRLYTLMVLVPGIFEMQFMSGEVSERTKKIARLFEEYHHAARRSDVAASAPRVTFPFARVIAVEQDTPPSLVVHPYDKASEYINSAEHIAVGTCYCRHYGELVGRPCDRPKEVCLTFGPHAQFVVDRGLARMISKEEALHILDISEKAGLVHCSSNTGKYIDFICNCCGCHCGPLRMTIESPPGAGMLSSFVVSVDEDECMGCGDCLDRCWMNALSLEGEVVSTDAARCIGCGLCVSVCPTGALALEARENAPVPPETFRDLNVRMAASVKQPEQ